VQWSSLSFFQQAEEAQQPADLPAEPAAADRGQEESTAADSADVSRADASLDESEPVSASGGSAGSADYAAEAPAEQEADRPVFAAPEQNDQADEQLAAEVEATPADLPEPIQPVAASTVPGQEAETAVKPDLKIALGAKKPEGYSKQQEAFGLSTLLQSNRREQEIRQAAAEEEQAKQAEAAALASAQGEEIEWKKLFLSRDPNAEAFRKVRMCIVQRDDTLDAIAGRYQLNPRELVLYNRLAEHEVSEGQVLLIP